MFKETPTNRKTAIEFKYFLNIKLQGTNGEK